MSVLLRSCAVAMPVAASLLIACGRTTQASRPTDTTVATVDPYKNNTLFNSFDKVSMTPVDRICLAPAAAFDSSGNVTTSLLLFPHDLSKVTDGDAQTSIDAINQKSGMKLVQYAPYPAAQAVSVRYAVDAPATELMRAISGEGPRFAGSSLDAYAHVIDGLPITAAASSHAHSYTFVAKLHGRSITLTSDVKSLPWRMTKYGEVVARDIAAQADIGDKIRTMLAECGSSYIAGVDFGAALVANLRATAAQPYDLSQFDAVATARAARAAGLAVPPPPPYQYDSLNPPQATLVVAQLGGAPYSLGLGATPADPSSAPPAQPPLNTTSVDCIFLGLKADRCADAFVGLVSNALAHDGRQILAGDAVREKTGTRNQLLAPALAGSLAATGSTGSILIGYEVADYQVSRVVDAGMFGRDGAAVSTYVTRQNAALPPGVDKDVFPAETTPDLTILQSLSEGVLNAYAYVSGSADILAHLDFHPHEQLDQLKYSLTDALSAIRETFQSCRSQPAHCAADIQTLRPKLPKDLATLPLRMDAAFVAIGITDFRTYCWQSAAVELRTAGSTPWRDTMARMARNVGVAPPTGFDFANAVILPGDASQVAKLSAACAAIANQGSSMQLRPEGRAPLKLLLAPLLYLRPRQLNVSLAGQPELLASLGAIADLESLEVHDATIDDAQQLNFDRLSSIKLYNPALLAASPAVPATDDISPVLRVLANAYQLREITLSTEQKMADDGTWLPEPHVSIDLGIYPELTVADDNAADKSLSISGNITLKNVEKFFAMTHDGSGVCHKPANGRAQQKWMPGTFFLDIGQDPDLATSPCCTTVVKACKDLEANGSGTLQCSQVHCATH